MSTTIEIREDQWQTLNAMKKPGDSFKDVVDRLLEHADLDTTPGVSAGESVDARVERAIEELNWNDRVDQRREAALAAVDYIIEHDGASKAELVEEVEAEYPVDGQSPRTWFRKTVRPVLRSIGEYDNGRRAWTV